jgi:hypothetical protein
MAVLLVKRMRLEDYNPVRKTQDSYDISHLWPAIVLGETRHSPTTKAGTTKL